MTQFYARLRDVRGDDGELAACIERIVNQLEKRATSGDQPGMLLGRIQSGKTRAFVGVIARAFDRGFDIAIVLTKGTKTLSAQTVNRLAADFREFIDQDECLVFDIKQPPGKLTKSERRRKLVIVAKKQADNLRRLIHFFESDYSDLKAKNILLVDDEADLASVRFVRAKNKIDIEQGKIADQIDELRNMVGKLAYLQVTATPYSLYLQPKNYEEDNYVFKPKRPSFTEILPIHSGYVGGNDYFMQHEKGDPRSWLFVEVQKSEQDALRKPDQRRIREKIILDSPNTVSLVRAIITFVLAVCIRRWQQADAGERKKKYAMVIHNDTQTRAHAWQYQVIDWVFKAIVDAASTGDNHINQLFYLTYNDLSASVTADKGRMPSHKETMNMFKEALQSDDIVMETVNKDNDVMALLDEKAELRLRTPYNIFVGGSILDRGITIPNLISFYYGRNPKTMQADTVLQHSRMYGNRDRRDLAVTRFFTSRDVYDRLYKINEFENTLREAFDRGGQANGVVFIQSDKKELIKPCSPNKVLLSNVITVKPTALFLPTDFTTNSGKIMVDTLNEITRLIPKEAINAKVLVSVSTDLAITMVELIEKTIQIAKGDFEWSALTGLIHYYSKIHENGDGTMLILAETGRRLHKDKSGDKSGLSVLGGTTLRNMINATIRTKPVLILLQQDGAKELGWSGHKFWWPLLAAPASVEPCVFATKVVKNQSSS